MKRQRAALALLLLCIATVAGAAGPRIAVLDFELADFTLTPNSPQEVQRTASLAPLLREALTRSGKYEPLAPPPDRQANADKAFGYLFDHPDEAAALGRALDADWIAVGRLHKPSDLFAYLKLRLVDARSARLAGDYVVEIKGHGADLARRGTDRLAEKMEESLAGLAGTGGAK